MVYGRPGTITTPTLTNASRTNRPRTPNTLHCSVARAWALQNQMPSGSPRKISAPIPPHATRSLAQCPTARSSGEKEEEEAASAPWQPQGARPPPLWRRSSGHGGGPPAAPGAAARSPAASAGTTSSPPPQVRIRRRRTDAPDRGGSPTSRGGFARGNPSYDTPLPLRGRGRERGEMGNCFFLELFLLSLRAQVRAVSFIGISLILFSPGCF